MPVEELASKRKWESCKIEPIESPKRNCQSPEPSDIKTSSHILRSNSNPTKPNYYHSESEYSFSDPETETNNSEKYGSKKYSACRSSIIKTSCRVNAFTKFYTEMLKPKLTPLHWDLLLETPFSHFFDLPDKWVVSNAVLHLLLECWNHDENAFIFNGVKLKFTPKEIGILLGLKHTGFLLSEDDVKSKGESRIQSKYFKKRRYITRKEIEQKLLELVNYQQNSTDFISVLVLYLFAMVLFPLTQNNVHSYLSHYVDSIENLKNYSWAGAVYNQLEPQFADLSNWASGRSEGLTYLRGCSLALLVWFYEHINQTKLRVAHELVPRMFNWNLSEQHQRTGNFKEMLDKIPRGKINGEELVPNEEEIIVLKEGLFNSNRVRNEVEIMMAIPSNCNDNNNKEVQIRNEVTIAIYENMGLNLSDNNACNEEDESEVMTPVANISDDVAHEEENENENCNSNDLSPSSSHSEHNNEIECSRKNVSSSLFSLYLDKLPSSSNPVSSKPKPIQMNKKRKSISFNQIPNTEVNHNKELKQDEELKENLFYPTNLDESLVPKIGLIFNSIELALQFYRKYANSNGFKAIKSSSQNHNGKKYRQVLSCQKTRKFKSRGKGLKPKWKSSESVKTDCGARIVLKIDSNENWVITEMDLGHNHSLFPPKIKLMDISSAPMDLTVNVTLNRQQIQENKIQETLSYPSNIPDSVIPNTGMVFNSIDEAFTFYTQYGISSGFLAIKSSFQKYNGQKCRQVLACNKLRKLDSRYNNRKSERKRRMIGRTDCHARIVLKIDENNCWVITEVEMGHNHDLLSPLEVQILRDKREKMVLAKQANPDEKKKRKPPKLSPNEKESTEENLFYPPLNIDESLVPKVGTAFDSTDEALNFYKEYSVPSGFKVIKSSSQKHEGTKYRQVLACQRVRKYKPRFKSPVPMRKSKTMKTDCRARVVLKIDESGKWVITEVQLGHNHELFLPCLDQNQIVESNNDDDLNLECDKVVLALPQD